MKHHTIKCAYCEEKFVPERRNRKYCSNTCKQYNYLTKKTGKDYRSNKILNTETHIQETPPLIIEEEKLQETIQPQTNKQLITITYELFRKEPPLHLTNSLVLLEWNSTLTG